MTARLWEVTDRVVELADQDFLWAETLTGATVTELGVLRQLNSDELRRKQDELRQAGGPPRAWRETLDRRQQLARMSK